MKYIFSLVIFASLFFFSSAQIDPIQTGIITQQISSTVVPENPTENQDVTISLTAYGTNLNVATISWSVNGSLIQKGVGMTQFTLNSGKNGETKRIVATISPSSGPLITKSFTISPQDVSIIYEANGYVSPFYKGKSIYTREGSVTLVALPNLSQNGVKLNPNNLIYKWIVDGTVQGSKSGYGKSSFSYTGSILGKNTFVEVEVTQATGSGKGVGNIMLFPEQPEVLLYEKSPLYGNMFNIELASNGMFLNEKETTILAVPFSTSATKLEDGTLSYTWTINGTQIPVPKNQNYATFRNSTGEQGTSIIGISISNSTHLLQMMRKSLSINF